MFTDCQRRVEEKMNSEKKILVVDDEEAICSAFNHILQNEEYEVAEAYNAKEALKKIPAFKPDLVLTDIHMPGMSGIELLQQIKKNIPKTEVIIITADSNIDIAVEAMKIGAYDFIVKPVNTGHLRLQIRRVFDSIMIKREHDDLALLNEMKDKFIALVNHEFRTPLGKLIGFHDFIKNDIESNNSREILDYLPILKSSTNSLIEIILKFASFSSLKEGHLRLDPSWFRLEDFMEEILKTFQLLTRERKLTFKIERCDNDLRIFLDRRKFSQVITELTQNAVKYTPDGGSIVLSAFKEEDANGVRLAISIKDDGIGIPEKKQHLIFEKFYEGQKPDYHSTSRFAFMGGGLGLGLPYAKEIVQAMKGEIFVESQKNTGSVFTVSIPLGKP